MKRPSILGMRVLSSVVAPESPNFAPSTWPPPFDFPVSIDSTGRILSRYGDLVWDLTPLGRRVKRLFFRDDPASSKSTIDVTNGELFRRCMAWWLWGPHAVTTASELETRFLLLRPIFELCTRRGICAERLHRFDKVIDELRQGVKPSQARTLVRLIHDIFEARAELGFFLLDRQQIAQFSTKIPEHRKAQTPYIPPRIWEHVANRTQQAIEDFLDHKDAFAEIFRSNLWRRERGKRSVPPDFSRHPALASVIQRWLGQDRHLAWKGISAYAGLVNLCALCQVTIYSLMRVEEAWSLPLNCLVLERDAMGEVVLSLKGNTSKTVKDSDARWIIAPCVEHAVKAASVIASLRLGAGRESGRLGPESEAPDAPLFPRSYEFWRTGKISPHAGNIRVLPATQELGRELQRFPAILDPKVMVMTEADVTSSKLLNPTVKEDRIAVGKRWPLSWHQFRRTGAVNMLASGLVSDLSLQYQLKHAGLAMSRYYGRGHYLLSSRFNEGARAEYVKTMYETLAREFAKLGGDRFVSPYGPAHKANILQLISNRDHKQLISEARKGKVAYREHLLGGCANPAPCDKGGFENVQACGGNRPCTFLLYDRERLPKYGRLLEDVVSRQAAAEPGSPLQNALSGQREAIEWAIAACEHPGDNHV